MLNLTRTFCPFEGSPADTVGWELRDIRIDDKNGDPVFDQRAVLCPAGWSVTATAVVASKYFRGHIGTPERETGIMEPIERVTDTIAEWLVADGYTDAASADAARSDLAWLCLHQHLAFNSPVWFEVGAEEQPQTSACFINSVGDNLPEIMDLAKNEALAFSGGSGSGTNFSALRADGEPLDGGGTASGPVSFQKALDAFAGVIKSGGKKRRAAKMALLDADHPDIFKFISCKADAEEAAHDLIDAGWPAGFDDADGAYAYVPFQNANHSVRVTDAFMSAVDADGDWTTTYRTTGATAQTVKARSILTAIAAAAWKCGDPGMQFDTTINDWHTCPNTGRIEASNPCQPAFATVLTPDGIRTFADIDVGSTIWSGKRWTQVTAKWSTGIKPVHRYQTTAGAFIGTENHRVVSGGIKAEVGTVDAIDTAVGPDRPPMPEGVDARDVMDGLVVGDGSARLMNDGGNLYMILHIGRGDQSYFTSPVSTLIGNRFDGEAYRVTTTITREELPLTYLRRVPARFLTADHHTAAGFLRGLYSANGSICGGRVTLKAASFGMISDVQQMLSALGIRSYYTTNKAHRVVFANGEYECRESYDLNITTDRDKFSALIGFIQPEKTARLGEALQTPKASRAPKSTYDIVSVDKLGEHEVFDITVDAEEHTYWTGGLLVSNCSEYVFLNDSACNLASLNLLRFLRDDNTFDTDRFCSAVRLAITAMDALIDRSSYPTEKIAKNSRDYRPLGLGYANLGALVSSLGLPYDSDEARHLAAAITSLMSATAYHQSAILAQSRGAFAGFEANREPMLAVVGNHLTEARKLYLSVNHGSEAERIADLSTDVWDEALDLGDAHGYRNAQVTVLAPTGTIGFMMDCDTTGIEPDFALVKNKKLVGGGYIRIVNRSVPRALQSLGYAPDTAARILAHLEKAGDITTATDLNPAHRPVFACANDISPSGHLRMMAAAQPFLSGAISKTVNLPHSATPADIAAAYIEAHKLGLKAVAIYRDGCKRSQPLNTKADPTPTPTAPPAPTRQRLPTTCEGIRHKFSIAGHDGYLHVGLYEDGRPGEVFVQMSKEGSTLSGIVDQWATALSIALQYGVPLYVLTGKMSGARFEPSGFTGNPEIPIALSITDYIGRWLDLRFNAAQPAPMIDAAPPPLPSVDAGGQPCTNCGTLTQRAGSCYVCPGCGTTTGCG